MKRIFVLFLTMILCLTGLIGCVNKPEDNKDVVEPTIEPKQLGFAEGMSDNLYYSNPSVNFGSAPIMGDPYLYYEESDKTFYLYGTTGGAKFDYYTSKDLIEWKEGGTCFQPTSEDWCHSRLWAPEMHKIEGKYYLYYSAGADGNATLHGSVAVSNSPKGPFTNSINDGVSASKPRFDFGFASIDGTVFVDDNGKMYYYFAKDQVGGISTIWGVELANPYTVKGEARQLTRVGYSKMTGEDTQEWEKAQGRWNEGPFVVKRNDIYYLTYSANMYTSKYYGVGYAMSYDPLDNFEKPQDCMLMGAENKANDKQEWDYVSGAGHHMFITLNNQTYVVYHKQYNIIDKGNVRIFCFDEYGWREDGSMFINGSTITPQPLPAMLSGYDNVMKVATITCADLDNSQKGMLKDGGIGVYDKNLFKTDVLFGAGKTTLTIKFNKPTKVRSILLYSGSQYDSILKFVDKVEFGKDFYIKGLRLNGNYIDTARKYMAIGNSITATLNEDIEVDYIKITINAQSEFSLSEIKVLGKLEI